MTATRPGGSLLELEDALVSMHGVAKRLALRDFSIAATRGHTLLFLAKEKNQHNA